MVSSTWGVDARPQDATITHGPIAVYEPTLRPTSSICAPEIFYYRGGEAGGVLRCVGVDAFAAVPATEEGGGKLNEKSPRFGKEP